MKKKLLASIGVFILVLFFTACSPNIQMIESEVNNAIKDSDLKPYINKISYIVGDKVDGKYPITIHVEVNKNFEELSTADKFMKMADFIGKIDTYVIIPSCGTGVECMFDKLQVSYKDQNYVMVIDDYNGHEDLELVINNNESYSYEDLITIIDETEMYDIFLYKLSIREEGIRNGRLEYIYTGFAIDRDIADRDIAKKLYGYSTTPITNKEDERFSFWRYDVDFVPEKMDIILEAISKLHEQEICYKIKIL